MTISPALNGFVKGFLVVLFAAGASYLGDVANLAPVIGVTGARLIAAVISSIESHIKDRSGKGLLGAVRVR